MGGLIVGMYTELEYKLELRSDEHLLELLHWLKFPWVSEDGYDCKPYPEFFANHKFFSKGRKWWFRHMSIYELESSILIEGSAELKDYENQIDNLFDMIKPFIIEGYYKSLYEEDWEWEHYIKQESDYE